MQSEKATQKATKFSAEYQLFFQNTVMYTN